MPPIEGLKPFPDVMMCRGILLAGLILLCTEVKGLGEVVYAVNCGGEAHADIYGVKYQKDPSKVGLQSLPSLKDTAHNRSLIAGGHRL